MFPAFLHLRSRRVVVVGGGPVAASKLEALLAAGADVTVVAPEVRPEIVQAGVRVVRRAFEDADLDGAWWVVAAAPREVNKQVLAAAEARRVFVNAVDDPEHATAYLGGVVRRDGVTVAISTERACPGAGRAAARGARRLAARATSGAGWPQRTRRGARGKRRTSRWSSGGPQLLEALNRLYEKGETAARQARVPLVSLVGAGPGDPELWTLRAVQRVKEADLVLYDALVDVGALRRLTRAKCFCVGKRARRDSVPQETIHRLMIRAAKQGKRVVRLKGGDPFVFGRGGEEALALAMAGVSVRSCSRRDDCGGGAGARGHPGDAPRHRIGIPGAGGAYVRGGGPHAAGGASEHDLDGDSDGRRRARRSRVEADGARLVGGDAGGYRVLGLHARCVDVDWFAGADGRRVAARRRRRRAGHRGSRAPSSRSLPRRSRSGGSGAAKAGGELWP